MNRRSFLGLSAASLATLSLASEAEGAAPTDPGRVFLSERQHATLAALAEVVNPKVDAFPSASALDIAGKLDGLFARMEPGRAAELAQALDLVGGGFLGLLIARRTERFVRLSPSEQAAEWAAWAASDSPLRLSVHKAFTNLCAATYWACPETWPAVGYPGPPL